MSQTVITTVFEQWKARQAESGEPVLLDEFVFASVPGLNPDAPIDRSEGMPPAAQIVHRQPVNRKGVVNDNAVVHSAVLGADVGDFTFNWIGLIHKASGTLAMIVHAPEQQKLKTKDGQQGNVLTRSFLMEYSGAQQETGISTPAETWQIDFTARMAGMDERQRIENTDIYGAAAFFGDGFLVTKTGSTYSITAGTGYVAGLRAVLLASERVSAPPKPVKVWVDVTWKGSLLSVWGVETKITVADALADYSDNGQQHYVFAVAEIAADGSVNDLRPKGSLSDQSASDALKKHEQSRNHPDATTKDKGFVVLSSSTTSESETSAATPKAVKAAMDNGNARLAKSGNGADIEDVSKFRGNLGLKSAALRDVGTGQGQLIEMGANLSSQNSTNIDFNSNNTPAFAATDGGKHTTTLVVSNGANDSAAAAMVFHRKGIHSCYFGIDTNNYLSVGGWSMGKNSYRIFHEGFTGNLSTQSDAQGRANQAQQNAIDWAYGSCVQDIRLGSSAEFQERGNNERIGGGVMTSFADKGSSNYWIRIRPLQKAVGGNWYTVGYQ